MIFHITPSPLLNELLASNVREAVDSYNGAKCTGKPHATQPGYHALGPQVFPDEHILTTQKDPAWGAPRAYGTPACASIFHNVCWDKGKDGGMPYGDSKRFRAAFWLNSYGTGRQEGVANLQRQPGRRLLLRHPSLRRRVPRQQRRRQGLQAGLHRRRMLPRPEQGYVGHLASVQRCVQRVRLVL